MLSIFNSTVLDKTLCRAVDVTRDYYGTVAIHTGTVFTNCLDVYVPLVAARAIIGYDKSATRLLRVTGPARGTDYWQSNLPRIRTHFKPRQIPFRCARMIRAPMAEVMYDPEMAPMEPGVGNDD